MASFEFEWSAPQIDDADSTDPTRDEDEEVRLEPYGADAPLDQCLESEYVGRKTPSTEILVRDIAVELSATLTAPPADTEAAFSQWLANSGITASHH